MISLHELFDRLLAQNGSDVHIAPGYPPTLRIRGDLIPVAERKVSPSDAETMLLPLLTPLQKRRFEATGDLDFGHTYGARGRFRVNYFRKSSGIGAVFRAIPTRIMTLDDLGVPAGVRKLADIRSGLVLVTGPTGSGKTTTLAAIIDHINRTRSGRILTIEDPIEFVHQPQRCMITHKEIGTHVPSFLEAIRSAGRENADVILVGELRGAETMRAALQLASFGILVYASVHTNSAAQTIDRYINAFPADQQPQIRGLLAESLCGIVAQQLVRRANDSGRVAAHEILFGSIALAGLIREAKPQQIPSLIQSGLTEGMQGMDYSLEKLVANGTVTARDALELALDKDTFQKLPIVAKQLSPEELHL